jgi:hypothetical protein
MSYYKNVKIKNVVGRADYLTNQERQSEPIVYTSPSLDWEPYIEYERAHQKSDKANNQARELQGIALPNSWAKLPQEELIKNCQHLAEVALEKSTDYQFAIHWNKGKSNLHLHVLFSERHYDPSLVTYYQRTEYRNAEGGWAKSKADRAVDAEGKELPPVHKKGDIKSEGFTVKDPRYTKTGWTHDALTRINTELTQMGYPQRERRPFELKQYHRGKGPDAEEIKKKNHFICWVNELLVEAEGNGVPPEELMAVSKLLRALLRGGADAEKWREFRLDVDNNLKTLVDRLHPSAMPTMEQPPNEEQAMLAMEQPSEEQGEGDDWEQGDDD